jgi:hypothetical protein
MAFRTGQFDSIPLQEVVGGATHAHRYRERAKAMFATEIAVESGPAEATEREQRKYETLQQEAWERIQGMQGSGEVGTEKERDWKEQCNLGGIETATLESAVKRKSAHFHRAARGEVANNQDGKSSGYQGWHRDYERDAERLEVTCKDEKWECCQWEKKDQKHEA